MNHPCRCGDWEHSECLQHPWAHPYYRKCSQLIAFGLDVKLKFNISDLGLASLHVELLPQSQWLFLRQTTAWALHISICYTWETTTDILEMDRAKYAVTYLRLPVEWIGRGGTAQLSMTSELFRCPLLRRARLNSKFRRVQFHISF